MPGGMSQSRNVDRENGARTQRERSIRADCTANREFLAEWERRFPMAEVHRFPEAGHYVLEDEADRLVPLVQAFLARHPLMKPVG